MKPLHIWMPLVKTATGSEGYTYALAAQLEQRGHRVTIDAVSHVYQYAPWLARVRPPVGADVILANSWNTAAFARRGLPLVSVCHLVVHDPRLTPFKSAAQRAFHRRFVLPMERAALRRASLNVAVSPLVARQMQSLLGARDVITVNNGVDTDYWTPPAERRAVGARPFDVLFVGKPSLRKGFDLVERILASLGPDVRFTCAGAPPPAGMARPPGDYVGMLDRAALREAYRRADLLLFPSRLEGLSLAVAEAMACGLPVLTCAGSGMDDFVRPDGGPVAGIVRAPEDVDGFVAELGALILNPQGHDAMCRAARAVAQAQFAKERWVDGMEQVLLQARALRQK